ncbi:putative Multidrug resistance protein ABC transporter family protein [Tripterygium wilfordii]|uniref:Putative Multidrug resistance protein ABC transporter family protein n=1 Tax=Tripterygium wilfordii TaxID=458696 RepID=A0A7J7DHY6_TRIWF|nr:uncharacterized protein LOC120001042 [Tripterygium wilfordii]KAF5745908.1 putative Multidrug resistance protein ABC transporter family protein [Tripterygium wilfordii]
MGNYITYRLQTFSTGKVILSDGSIQEFDKPLTVAELMMEHPQQVVVEFDRTQKRPIPLPADKMLDFKKVYLMLPVKRGKPVPLPAEQAHRILLNVARTRSLLSTSRFLPLFARICSASVGEGRNFVVQRKGSEEEKKKKSGEIDRWVSLSELLPESMEERPEYLSRQISGKGWKPSLDPIKEKRVEKKVPHWLF